MITAFVRNWMDRRSLLSRHLLKLSVGTFILLALLAGCQPQADEPRELVVNTFGGTFEEHWRDNVLEPFQSEHNVTVLTHTSFGPDVIAGIRAQRDDPPFDVVIMDTHLAQLAAEEGLLEVLDPAAITNIGHQLPSVAGTEHYVKWLAVTQAIVYNPAEVSVPTSWQDLWDTEEYCGKIALPAAAHTQGTLLVLTAARLNGGDINNVDPGFAALQELSDCVAMYWTSHDQLAQAFEQGEVAIATWSNDRAQSAADVGVPVEWIVPEEGVYVIETSMGIVKNTDQKELAEEYVNFILSQEVQAANARDMYLLPTNSTVELDESLANKLPYGPAFENALIPVDWITISEVRDGWAERYNREVSGGS